MIALKKPHKGWVNNREITIVGHDAQFYYLADHRRIDRKRVKVKPGIKCTVYEIDFVNKKLINVIDFED